jgi:hypothetical protein
MHNRILMAVAMKPAVLWDVTPCSLVHSDVSENLLHCLWGRGHPDFLKRRHKSTKLHKDTLKRTQLLSDNETVTRFVKWNKPCNVRIVEGRSCDHCCSGKAISMAYSECVFVCVCVFLAFCIQHAMRVSHSRPWPVRLHSNFPHYLTKGTIFEEKNSEYKTCVLIYSTTFIWNNCHSN